MARASIAQEIHLEAPDETGLLGRIVSALAVEGVYIIHLSAYSVNGRAYVQAITRDNSRAAKALAHFIKEIKVRDVLVVEFENKTGTLAPVVKLLGSRGIGIEYAYGTSADGFKIVGVFATSDNARAASLINGESAAPGV